MNPNNKIVERNLSNRIVGILFEVHTKLGGNYQEKYYQRAVEELLKEKNINYRKELAVDLEINTHKFGKYYLDFLIEEKVVLEFKAKPYFHPDDFKQVKAYLNASNLELGILANFRGRKLEYKRILNGKLLKADLD